MEDSQEAVWGPQMARSFRPPPPGAWPVTLPADRVFPSQEAPLCLLVQVFYMEFYYMHMFFFFYLIYFLCIFIEV